VPALRELALHQTREVRTMKCYVCGYSGDFLAVNGIFQVWVNPQRSVPVRLHVCPDCGAVHTDMGRHVMKEDRKPKR